MMITKYLKYDIKGIHTEGTDTACEDMKWVEFGIERSWIQTTLHLKVHWKIGHINFYIYLVILFVFMFHESQRER